MKPGGIDDPTLERDIRKLTKNYLAGEAFIDILANVPIFVFNIANNFEHNPEKLQENMVYNFCMLLKFLRLAHANEVSQSLKRLFVDYLGEIFYL